jgi:hypothetical protein
MEGFMKIFIAGAREIKHLDKIVLDKLLSIQAKGFDVLVGDAYGVDSAVQKFYADKNYANVHVFASNGRVRHNLGNWTVESIPVGDNIKGFDFYAQKDMAMAKAADYGLMIWNGESKGTLNNILNLLNENKSAVVYLAPQHEFYNIDNSEKAEQLLSLCPASTRANYAQLAYKQIAMF